MFFRSKILSFKTFYYINSVRNLFLTNRLKQIPDCVPAPHGLVLGLFTFESDLNGQNIKLTSSGQKFNELIQGKLMENLQYGALPPPELGEVKVLYGLHISYPAIAVVGLGRECVGYNPVEIMDERKEHIRLGIGAGVRALQFHSLQYIYIDSCGHAESAAEGAALGIWMYQELRHHSRQKTLPRLELYDSCDFAGWRIGLEKASAQNLARQLQETPRNLLTPSSFAQTSVEILSKVGICTEVKMRHWAKLRNLNAFLTVAKGSCEPPVFLEILYEGCDPDMCPIVMIGKGCTFDSGGLCIKSCEEMQPMRGDMSGAACVVATMRAVSNLQLPVNIRGLIPLCENAVGATAFKPGDVCAAVNNKTILVEDTDAEGVLMLADTLNYAREFNPKFIIDVGTITPEVESGLGSAACGVFCNNESLYETMRIASIHSGDRIWRLPLWRYFSDYVKSAHMSDLTNQKYPRKIGGPGKAVAFLREFLPNNIDWIHLDNYGVAKTSGETYTYLRKGMSGRPTRTLIEFIAQFACQIKPKEEQAKKCIT